MSAVVSECLALFCEPMLAAMQSARVVLLRLIARHQRRRRAWDAYDALRRLDDRTLRDIGFSRDELSSVAAEFAGDADRTRVRALEKTSTRNIFYG